MNNAEIAKLSAELQELEIARSNSIGIAAEMLDRAITEKREALKKLAPVKGLGEALVQKVLGIEILESDTRRYDDVLPIVALKSINGAAYSVIRHVVYLNRVHEAIQRKNAMSVAGTSAWKKTSASTSPYDDEETKLLQIKEECEDCMTELAVLFACHEKAADRITASGKEVSEYDAFPDVGFIIRNDAAKAAESAARRRAQGAVVSALSPNIVSMID